MTKEKIDLKDESGQSVVEYGLILSLIVLAAVAMLSSVGVTMKTILYDDAANSIKKALNP